MSKCVALIISLSSILVWSCGSLESSQLSGDEKAAVDKTHEFLTWYKSNYHKILTLTDQLVPGAADSVPDNAYFVDFTHAETYVDFLDSSGLFSKGYVLDLYNYLQDCDQRMRLAKQSDGPPLGLEVDPILKTHEPQDIFEQLETCSIKSVTVNQQKASVHLVFTEEKSFSLVKINDRWFLE